MYKQHKTRELYKQHQNKTFLQTTQLYRQRPNQTVFQTKSKQDSCTNNAKQDSCIDIKTGQMYKQRQTRHVPSTSNKTVVQHHQNKTYQIRQLYNNTKTRHIKQDSCANSIKTRQLYNQHHNKKAVRTTFKHQNKTLVQTTLKQCSRTNIKTRHLYKQH